MLWILKYFEETYEPSNKSYTIFNIYVKNYIFISLRISSVPITIIKINLKNECGYREQSQYK